MADACPVLAGEAQMHAQRGEVVGQASDRGWVEPAVCGGELLGAAGGFIHGLLAGWLVNVIEDRPERGFDGRVSSLV